MDTNENQHFDEDKTFKIKGAQGLTVQAILRKDGTATVHYHNISEPVKDDESWTKEEDIKFEGTYQIIDKKQNDILISIEIAEFSNSYKCTDDLYPEKSETRNETRTLKVTIELTHTITDELAHLSKNLLMYL
jgi:hypothetical protein